MTSYKHLQFWERKVIKKMLKDGNNLTEISTFLSRDVSTISRELSRNGEKYWYHPLHANEKYLDRRSKSKTSKIEKNPNLQDYILSEMQMKKSPDSIAGRLKLAYKKQPDMHISHETIYQWIYKRARLGDDIYKNLPRSLKKRQRRIHKIQKRLIIPNRVSIHSRSKSVESRTRIGHWEADTVTGKGRSGYIATIVERKSLFLVAGHMINKKPSNCNRAILEAFGEIPNKYIKTITFDNGTEFYNHVDLQIAFECKNYFADPYCSWQRGINEHINGMMRKYFPKSMSFNDITQNDVYEVVGILNNTPRKSLGYKTPNEVFHNLSVALQT